MKIDSYVNQKKQLGEQPLDIKPSETPKGTSKEGLSTSEQRPATTPTQNEALLSTKEMKQATQTLLQRGVPLTKENLQDLKAFLEKEPGTIQEKMATIQSLANKKLDVTTTNLRPVHEALHGQPVGQLLHNLTATATADPEILNKIQETIPRSDQTPQAPQAAQTVQTDQRTGSLIEQTANQEYRLNHETVAALKLPTKDIVVSEITARLNDAANQFRDLKREINRNLDNIIRVVQPTRANVHQQVSQALESAIDRLDRAILKSDITLYSDMKMEKQLMKASTDLAEARQHLANGNNAKAVEIFNQVKAMLDKMNFRPAEIKVHHMLTKDPFLQQNQPPRIETQPQPPMHQQSQNQLQTAQQPHQAQPQPPSQPQGQSQLHTQPPSQHQLQPQPHQQPHTDTTTPTSPNRPEPSARQTFELIRALGLNHDSEVAQRLVALPQNNKQNQTYNQSQLQYLRQNAQNPTTNPTTTNSIPTSIFLQPLLSQRIPIPAIPTAPPTQPAAPTPAAPLTTPQQTHQHHKRQQHKLKPHHPQPRQHQQHKRQHHSQQP
ncbi:hypothetical protein [Heliorestis convoluta]|uniref:Uncharacterized protein n=1 Tax=Heliorestis convoluta TaxID=356322 RepID=A0A5Q2N5J6_9FIRM|nr:hypothetical protein [Heliorestis convoluta]QGG47510.1 hypothetical protein FTV88_1363 [Heliorestis convoluta]